MFLASTNDQHSCSQEVRDNCDQTNDIYSLLCSADEDAKCAVLHAKCWGTPTIATSNYSAMPADCRHGNCCGGGMMLSTERLTRQCCQAGHKRRIQILGLCNLHVILLQLIHCQAPGWHVCRPSSAKSCTAAVLGPVQRPPTGTPCWPRWTR